MGDCERNREGQERCSKQKGEGKVKGRNKKLQRILPIRDTSKFTDAQVITIINSK